jgi:hypothetical protein
MVCLRGPCQHYWAMIMRLDSPDVGQEFAQRLCSCIRHTEEMDLREQTVYACGQWWPAQLALVPESARSLLRPTLRRVWERRLQRAGIAGFKQAQQQVNKFAKESVR